MAKRTDGNVSRSKLVPEDTLSDYGIIDSNDATGGPFTKATLADRDAIKPGLRTIGATCDVAETGLTYRLIGGILNTHWRDVASPSGVAKVALAKWYAGGISGKVLCHVGDSTTAQFAALNQLAPYTGTGRQLSGVTLDYKGYSGETALSILTGHINEIVAVNADLYVIGVLTNDGRTGGADQATMQTRLDNLVNAIRKAVPKASIILRMPNPFLAVDTGQGYVTPIGNAQLYYDRMRAVYLARACYWPDVYVLDTGLTVWGTTAPPGTNTAWADTIHPSSMGYRKYAAVIANLASEDCILPDFATARAQAAQDGTPTAPWTDFDGILDDAASYSPILVGSAGSSGSGFFDVAYSGEMPVIRWGDIVRCHGQAPFTVSAAPIYQSAGVMRFLVTPPAWQTGAAVTIYRPLYYQSTAIQDVVQRNYVYELPIRVGGGGNGYIDIFPLDPLQDANTPGGMREIASTDTIAFQGGAAAISLSGTTRLVQSPSGTMRILKTGDYTSYAGLAGVVYGSASLTGRNKPKLIPGRATITTTATTVAANDYFLPCDPTTFSQTINLPDASVVPWTSYLIKKIGSSVNTVTLKGSGAQTIDCSNVGPNTVANTLVVTGICEIRSNGTGWDVIRYT